MPGAEAKLKAEAEVKLAVNFYRTDVGWKFHQSQ